MLGKKLDKPRRKYDEEFKADVIKMVSDGRSVRETALSLGINENIIHKWRARHNESSGLSQSLPEVVIPSVTGAEHERVKARLREVEQERDILKKALDIFSRGI
jgi:transposase